MRLLQVGERVWLVVADTGTRIHFVIEYGPAVHQRTHETLMMYRVDHFVIKRAERWPLGFYDELQQAVDACALSLGMPNFLTPVTAPDGSIVTAAEQRARWQMGQDPRSGESTPEHVPGARPRTPPDIPAQSRTDARLGNARVAVGPK